MVRETWISFEDREGETAMQKIIRKLSGLKRIVIHWERENNTKLAQELTTVEENINSIFTSSKDGFFSKEEKDLLGKLKHIKDNILKIEVETWCLKNRSIWLS